MNVSGFCVVACPEIPCINRPWERELDERWISRPTGGRHYFQPELAHAGVVFDEMFNVPS